ncbi:crossover junction endodeoxyribonuclease RuvC [Chroococcidiopsis sp.]|uniref:crossover junction endodeoxyribonuclease RuvC n=1 Tax=Chroococcidiopsis sp. TaxID=3088168 RepID=UPI003F343B8D
MPYVLGIDSGVKHIGLSVFDPERQEPVYCVEQKFVSYSSYYTLFCDFITEWNPQAVYIEKPFFTAKTIGKNTVTLELIGIQKLVCDQRKIPAFPLSPKAIKKEFTGNGNAKKEQVIDAVRSRFELSVKSSHIADAIAIAYTGHKLSLNE